MPQHSLKVEFFPLENGRVRVEIEHEASLTKVTFGDNLFLRSQELVNAQLQMICNRVSVEAAALKRGRR